MLPTSNSLLPQTTATTRTAAAAATTTTQPSSSAVWLVASPLWSLSSQEFGSSGIRRLGPTGTRGSCEEIDLRDVSDACVRTLSQCFVVRATYALALFLC